MGKLTKDVYPGIDPDGYIHPGKGLDHIPKKPRKPYFAFGRVGDPRYVPYLKDLVLGSCRHENPEYLKKLLQGGKPAVLANAKDADDQTPLHVAAYFDHLLVIKVLLEAGGDVNALNKDGRTPLDMAQRGNSKKAIDLLKENGAQNASK